MRLSAPHRRLPKAGHGGREPAGRGDRPTGMATVTLRRAFTAALLAASLTTFAAGCGADRPDGSGPAGSPANGTAASTTAVPSASDGTSGSTSGNASDGETIASRVAYFSSSAVIATAVHQVLHDAGELGRFAQQVAAADPRAAADITDGGKATDFSRQVLVGWTQSTGCSTASSARLTVSGDRLTLRVDQPEPPPECLRAFWVTVVFEVPKERIPAQPVFG